LALTGWPLLIACCAGTVLAIGLTVLGWRRGGRGRLVTRTVSVLTCQAVALLTLGVVINKAEDLYPSWATLLHAVPKPKAVAAPTARLDGPLYARDASGGRQGVTFPWTPAGWTGWGLAVAPEVSVPQAYFDGPLLRFPVVVVAAAPADHRVPAAVTGVPAVVVVLRPTHGTDALDDRLPYALNLDLRVEPHGWALVGAGADAPLVLAALARRPERYQEAALVAAPATLAARRPDSGEQPVYLASGLAAALRWIDPLLPAPLNPPETGPIGIPPKPRVHAASPAPSP
jgi:hypothetical protein